MSKITPQEAKQIAEKAYIYGLQQAVFYVARFVFTQLEAAPKYVGVNRLIFNYKPSGPDDREIVTPNATTLYGAGFFDLSEEPLIVELPEIVDRYYSFQAMDQYGDYFFYAGNQFTGREAQQFILVGPNWAGKIPAEFAGTHIVNAPSAAGFMIARIALKSYADAEVKAVNGYQDKIMATPLNQWLENGHQAVPPAQRPKVKGNYAVFPRMPQLVRALVEVQTAMDYFQLLSLALNDPTMTKRTDSLKEVETLTRLARIGLMEGNLFDPAVLDKATRDAMEAGFEAGKQTVKAAVRDGMIPMNGWMVTKDMGNFGTDYLTRAAIADAGWGGPEAKSHVGGFCFVDAEGQKLNGGQRYTLTLDTNNPPPCTEFWSIPIYDIEGYFIDNEINRYTVNSFMVEKGGFYVDDQGQLTFYIQRERPTDPNQVKNWLPAPAGDFRLVARFYGPKAPLIDGSYPMPRPVRV
ncbi:DUF1254 domain-containing protein [Methanosarcina sp. 2.H.A.1B.4]|uniref:DUF1254 domain-containing protein n=1 Tax=Methanosarcina sp. 2.H.A.1B.4 TaxID=1483600 RepID=UPI0006215281|nr:DUF1254 domain-containing protein [Methanosarcina sp. 2.H.A.1B.4]KKG07768.1 hypothetical protein EO92_04235 [Methanosarcina sp. 2.H.A.1B.4]